MYALVDCNNFYVSCERVFQPQLNGKPVVVLSNNDGCIISRSNEAKGLGIPMGAPEFKVRDLIKQHDIKVFSSNYALYGDLSCRVMKTLEHFTPNVEVYSIDEAFLCFSGQDIVDYHEYGLQIRQRIIKWLSIPTGIGFAPTKALSKIANHIAKKFHERTQGVYVIDTDEKRIKALKWTKIEDVWGIGFRLTKKMQSKNIKTAYDFTLPHNEAFIRKEMGVVGMRLKYELEGKSVLEMEEPKAKKNIAVTRSFEKDISDFNELKERVVTFASVCSEKLRKQNSFCNAVILYLRKDPFNTNGEKYSFYRMQTLPFSSNTSFSISQTAISMLKDLYQEGTAYKKAGVIVTEIVPSSQRQFKLFDEENPKYQKLMEVMDAVQDKTGERKLRLASQDLKRTWKMKQNHLSNRYTTNFNELLEVKCK
ncbi:DNA polymerase V [Flavobacterium aquaticum]|uniref:DNA polymerase V n=1 Tax=Flavobacterium aquaticum TaxID=1236486 RepID=A0A327YKQ6_9FLAO|nr:Y-family DNA polymerase [Flavobacterium aquaticum]RAK20992.1 DNA polymerase V [Flavobacterium aquaticum]